MQFVIIILMRIEDTMIYLGKPYHLIYEDMDDFSSFPYEKCTQVYGICFCDGKVVIGFSKRMQKWSLIGGTIGESETFEETLKREVQEESNMKVLRSWLVGYQKLNDETQYQLRYVCIVEPYGPFISDPDAGDGYGVDRVKLIDPKNFKKYLDWGKVGNRLIERALEIIKFYK
jgi:8-oxo-dGTP pyrophosphatase MutT (NUDIX family)